MEENNGARYEQQVAPFVAKTYQMVSDLRTDALICWGKDNNSFLVLDQYNFSKFILPYYFKHCNFSSFVRQLNTYGFKKVDPDRWEFAHEAFLRGQIHLLPRVVRRAKMLSRGLNWRASTSGTGSGSEEKSDAKELGDTGDEAELIREIGRLREEQRNIEEELQLLNKRLQESDKKPRQILSFIVRVAEDPELLPRLVSSKQKQKAEDKRRRLVASDPRLLPSPSPPPPLLPPLLPQLHAEEVLLPCDMGSAVQKANPLEVGNHPLIIQEVKPFTLTFDGSCDALISSYGTQINDAVDCEEEGGMFKLNTGNFTSFQTELQMIEDASEAAPAEFPFSLLGHVFF